MFRAAPANMNIIAQNRHKKSCKDIFHNFTGFYRIWRRRWDLNPCDGIYPSYSLSRELKA